MFSLFLVLAPFLKLFSDSAGLKIKISTLVLTRRSFRLFENRLTLSRFGFPLHLPSPHFAACRGLIQLIPPHVLVCGSTTSPSARALNQPVLCRLASEHRTANCVRLGQQAAMPDARLDTCPGQERGRAFCCLSYRDGELAPRTRRQQAQSA